MSFFRYEDPALAAKPGFHDQAPGGVGGVAVPNGHTLNILPELIEDFTENPLAGRTVQSNSASRIVIDLTGGALAQTAQPAVIELVLEKGE